MFGKIKKIKNKISGLTHQQGGMTYVELIVVLGIFSVMSSVVLFNYGAFQAKVDIKNLANDIALKVVEAQKSALSGLLQTTPFSTAPAYGVYFDLATPKSFLYFADLNNSNTYVDPNCTGECLNQISITKGDFISQIDAYSNGSHIELPSTNLSVTFKRPDSSAIFSSGGYVYTSVDHIDYMQITISSPQAVVSTIKIYPSGRIQIN